MTALVQHAAPIVSRLPERVAVVRRIVPETPDTSTYWLTFPNPLDRLEYRFQPGQFNMLYLFGGGEVPISVSSRPGALPLAHTVRWTGRVTDGFGLLSPGDQVLVRGPFGTPWPLSAAEGRDLLVVAGGLGLAPVRPAIYEAIARRTSFDRVMLLVGARGPEHMLYMRELVTMIGWKEISRIEVLLTVDTPDDAWPFHEGVVTTLFDRVGLRPERTTTFICGPEMMMHLVGVDLESRGVERRNMYVSLERNMQCGERLCGHCQFGPHFVCHDGPVFNLAEISDDLKAREL